MHNIKMFRERYRIGQWSNGWLGLCQTVFQKFKRANADVNKFTVRKKLLGSFLVTIVLASVVGGTGLISKSSMQSLTGEITNSSLKGVETIGKINLLAQQMLALQATMIMEPNDANKKQFLPQSGVIFKQIDDNLELYSTIVRSDEERQHF